MLRLRPFKNTDAAHIVSWVGNEEEYVKWSAGNFGSYPITPQAIIDESNKFTGDEKVFFMTACEDEKPIGFLLYKYREEKYDVVHLGAIIVDSSLRGRGYGKSMVKLAQKYAFEILGVRKITLNVFDNNAPAYRTYLAAGFSETKNVRDYDFHSEKWVTKEMAVYSQEAVGSSENERVPEEHMVKEVINNNSFTYAFQPIINAVNGEVFGYEALMRAEYEGNPISPLQILGYATKHNRLYDIEKATLFNVLERYAKCLFEFKDKKLFVNSIPGFLLKLDDYEKIRERYGQYFKNIIVEVTENTEFSGNELDSLLKRSAEDGFGVAIDDYGTGYSNTASLLKYLPDCVKIDRLLITDINEDTKKQHFVKGLVEFAHGNGFKALAEGVETPAELKTVIDMGVDLIQGFYTARPSFEVIEAIDLDVQNEIVNANHKSQGNENRKILVVDKEKELPLMRVALEQYTAMLISEPEFTLVGNTKYCAEMSVKIKDGLKCRMTIRDVFLESYMQLPCIEIGKNAELTLVLEGENRLRKLGIHVPEGSSLRIEGDGNLGIRVQGIDSFAIGTFWDNYFGSFEWAGTGSLDILVEADQGVGIGGGRYTEGKGITLSSGTIRIEPACSSSVAIGCVNDTIPIRIDNCNLQLDIKSEKGIGIGNGGTLQNIRITNSKMNIICAGTCIAGIGSYDETNGSIVIKECELSMLANGQQLYLIGAKSGPVSIELNKSNVNVRGEGNEVMAVGTRDMMSLLKLDHSTCSIKLASGTPLAWGAKTENMLVIGGTQSLSINE